MKPRADENLGLTLNVPQLRKRRDKFPEFQAAELLGRHCQTGEVAILRIFEPRHFTRRQNEHASRHPFAHKQENQSRRLN
jgi:hypothetical protein